MSFTDEESHEFTDGMFVTFSGIQGMTELNGCAPIEIKVRGTLEYQNPVLGKQSDRSSTH